MGRSVGTIGERLRRTRQRQQLSQNDLAVKARVHPLTVSRIERGVSQPSVETLRALARALDVKLDRLAG